MASPTNGHRWTWTGAVARQAGPGQHGAALFVPQPPTLERMGRRTRRRPDARLDAGAGALVADAVEDWQGEDYLVRRITGSTSTKPYRCPGCDHEIRPATPHVVAWPVDDRDAGHRRHWHAACWQARDRRRATMRRPGGAPRY